MKVVVAAFNQEKAPVGAFSVIDYEPFGCFSSTVHLTNIVTIIYIQLLEYVTGK